MESELLFVWIEEFRSLKNVGFNFSNKFDIEYISDSNEIIVNFINGENAIELKDGIHYFKEKEYYLDDFFSNENELGKRPLSKFTSDLIQLLKTE